MPPTTSHCKYSVTLNIDYLCRRPRANWGSTMIDLELHDSCRQSYTTEYVYEAWSACRTDLNDQVYDAAHLS